MSNVYNRRLFKPRPARAKLNQMGGIMASSVPLMQSVQKFSNGNKVRVGGSNPLVRSPVRTSYVPGQGYTQFSPLTNPAVQATIARNVQRQRAANVGIPDMPATGLVPQDTRGFFKRLLDETVEAKGPLVTGVKTLFGGDPVARANLVRSGLGLEAVDQIKPKIRPGIQTDNPEEDLITEDVPPTFGQRIGAETDDAGFVGTDTELFTMDDSPSANVTLSALGKDDEDVITDKTPLVLDPRLGYLGRDDGDEDSRQIADVTKGRDDDDGEVPTKRSPKKTKEDVRQTATTNTPTALEVQLGEGTTDTNAIVSALQGLTSETDKNDVILEAADKKDVEEKLTIKQRIAKNKELAKELGLFEDAEADRKIDSFNLAFMGFAIATDGLEKGLAKGTERMRDTAESRKKRKDLIDKFALETAFADERSEKQFEREMQKYDKGLRYDYVKTLKLSQDKKDIAAANIAATRANLMTRVAVDKSEGAKDRDAMIRGRLLTNFDESMSMAYAVAIDKGLDTTDNEVINDIILPQAVKFSEQLGSSKKPGEVGSLERIYQDAFESLDKQVASQGLPFDLRDKTGRYTPQALAAVDDYVNRVLGKVKDSPKTVTNKEEYDALPSGTRYVDPNGVPGVKP